MEKNTSQFKVIYDGAALETHEMDVKDLAPALLAIGELFEAANKALNPDKVRVAVNMKATEAGSIEVGLVVAQSAPQLIDLFTNNTTTAIVNAAALMQVLGVVAKGGATLVGGGGLIHLIKWLRGRTIRNIIRIDTGDFNVEASDGEVRVWSKKVIRLFGILDIRKSVEAIVRPLEKEGVDKVAFLNEGEKEEITKDEKDYFKAPIIEEEIIKEVISETALQIVSPTFTEGSKWKFSGGGAVFFADILDQDFIRRVQNNEIAFAKDDLLTVQLKTRQYLVNGQIKADYSIIKVLDHRSAAVQIQLPFSDE